MQASPKAAKERIKVFARCRPVIEEEKKGNDCKSCVEIKGNEIKVSRPNHQPKTFSFDGIFGPDSTQEQVFKTVSLDAIEDVFNGYHSTIFVYGQTGTGKTHTLSNIDDSQPEEHGLVPRCVQEIYRRIDSDINNEYRVRMNYLQIYMETLQDLLQPDHKNLQIREDPELGIYVSGICFRDIKNYEECIKYYREGDVNRVTALTKMLNGREELEGLEKKKVTTANLFLVDLAGSERLKKTEAEGIRKKEANYINLSLTTLGIVIHSLEANHIHIPFRDSKLTRLLQDSLGGNGKTRIVITISPSIINSQETIGSLMFGERAMNVKTVAKVNEAVDYRALYLKTKAQLDSLEEKYSELEEDYLDITNENDKMDIEIDSLLEENKKLVKEKKILEKEKEKEKEKIVSLMKGDLLDLENQHEKDIAELNDRLLSVSKEYENDFQKKEENLKKILFEKDNDIDRLELLVQELTSDKTFLEAEFSTKDKEIENLIASTHQMERDLETASYLCIRRENELEQVQELIQQLEKQITTYRETIGKNVDEIELLKRKILFSTEEMENVTRLKQEREAELEKEKRFNNQLKDDIELLNNQNTKLEERLEFEVADKALQKEMFREISDRELLKERKILAITKEQHQVELEQMEVNIEKLTKMVNEKNEEIEERGIDIDKLKLMLFEEQRERENDKMELLLEQEKQRTEKESILIELQYYKDKIEEFTSKVFSTPNNTTIINIVEETSDPSSVLQTPPTPMIEKVPIFDFGKIVNVQTSIIKRHEHQFFSLIIKNLISEQQRDKLVLVINKLTKEKEGLQKELQKIGYQLKELHTDISELFANSRFLHDDLKSTSELFGTNLHQTLFEKQGHSRSFDVINGELKDLKFISKKFRDESPDEAAFDAINYMVWALEYSHPYSSLSDNLLGEENSKEIIKSLLEESEKRVKSSSKTSAEHTLEIDCIWKHVKNSLDCFYDSSTDNYKTVLKELDCEEYYKLYNNFIRKKNATIELEELAELPYSIYEILSDSRIMVSKTRNNCSENSDMFRLMSFWFSMSSKCLKKVLNREEINHKAGVYLMHEFIHLLHTVRNVLYLFDCSERDVLIYKLALHGCASKLSKFINSSEEVRREMEDRIASYEELRTRTEAALVIQRFYRKTKRRMQEDFIRKQRTELIAQSQAQMVKIRELQKSELTFKASVGKQIADTGRVLIKQGVSELDHIFNILKAYFLYGDDDDTPLTPSSPRTNTSRANSIISPNSPVLTTPERNRSGSLSPSPPNPLRENFGGRPKSTVSRAYSKRFSEVDVAEINDILSNTKVSPTARKLLLAYLIIFLAVVSRVIASSGCILNRDGNCGMTSNAAGELLLSVDPKQQFNTFIKSSSVGNNGEVICSTPNSFISNPLCKERWFRKAQHDKQFASNSLKLRCNIDVVRGDCQIGNLHFPPENQYKFYHNDNQETHICSSIQGYYSNQLCKEKWFRKLTLSQHSLLPTSETSIPSSIVSHEVNNIIAISSTSQTPSDVIDLAASTTNNVELTNEPHFNTDLTHDYDIVTELAEAFENNDEDDEFDELEIDDSDETDVDEGTELVEELQSEDSNETDISEEEIQENANDNTGDDFNNEEEIDNKETYIEEEAESVFEIDEEDNVVHNAADKPIPSNEITNSYTKEIEKTLKEIIPYIKNKPKIVNSVPYIQSATNVSGSIGKTSPQKDFQKKPKKAATCGTREK
ncbi:kinesin [Naegleria gruberi]|uniref:Kinesin n=1 Tax=Naegleria gruberi TaxID=5762 RepID=D2UXZ3_NAEGR|nr:kinesin [Naegleria gruberi]EFC50379.1 kinesin [Naegleria gruberi]|eukprot:XP_002683123.1 kinesin [Naegleria gruberi]